MSTKIRIASAAVLVAVPVALVSADIARASVGPQDLPADVRECVAPILKGGPSADVVQGWIDSCRTLSRHQRAYDDTTGPGGS